MSTTTTNYGLIKPDTSDPILIGQINDNMDTIDTVLKDHSDKIDAAALGIKFKGEVNYYADLPNNAEIGDAYTVKYAGSSGTTPDGTEYVWGAVSGTNQWINFSKDSYTKAEVDALLGGKVDKETGKGLSTNDFTTAEKTKLDDLAEIKSIGTGLNLDDNGELTATGGGSGGTTNYNDLSNKPQINGNTLSGNKTSAQLGLASASDIPTVPITAIQKNGTGITPVSGTVNITVPTQASDINAATATQGDKADTAIQGIKVNNSTVNPDSNKVVSITVPTTAADVSALPDTTKYAAALSLTINSSTYVITGQLKDQNGDNLGAAQTIDLPLESVVVGGSYNSQTKKVVLTLQNGNTIEFSVADLVSGLQTELSASNKLNPAYINYDSTHRAVSDTEKSTWNGKQDALTTAQLAAANSGIDSAKVAQIETNKNNISNIQLWEQYDCLDKTHPNDIDIDNSELTVYHNAFLKRVVITCKIKFLLQRTSASTALLIGNIVNIPNYTKLIPLNSVREFVSTSACDAFIAKNATNYAIAFAVNSGTLAANTEIRAQFEYTYF